MSSALPFFPLLGHTVAVTRTAAGELGELLRAQGAEVLTVPLIRFGPTSQPDALHAQLRDLRGVSWLLLTSPQGSVTLCAELASLGLTPADLAGVRLAAVGEATACPLRDWGLNVAFLPTRATAQALGRELPIHPAEVALHLTSQLSEEALSQELTRRGALYRRLELYRTEPASLTETERGALAQASVVTLASGSAAQALVALASPSFDLLRLPVAVIGEQTARAVRELGFVSVTTAPQPSLGGLVQAAIQAAHRNAGR